MEFKIEVTGTAGSILAQVETFLRNAMADVLGGPIAIEQGYSAKIDFQNMLVISMTLDPDSIDGGDEIIASMVKTIVVRKLEKLRENPIIQKYHIGINWTVTINW